MIFGESSIYLIDKNSRKVVKIGIKNAYGMIGSKGYGRSDIYYLQKDYLLGVF